MRPSTTPPEGPTDHQVRQILGSLPDPEPMPPDLADRILASIGQEIRVQPAQSGAVISLEAVRRRKWVAAASVAAAVAGIATVGSVVVGGPRQIAAIMHLLPAAPKPSTAAPAPKTTFTVSRHDWSATDLQVSRPPRIQGHPPTSTQLMQWGNLASAPNARACYTRLTGQAAGVSLQVGLGTSSSRPALLLNAAGGRQQALLTNAKCQKLAYRQW